MKNKKSLTGWLSVLALAMFLVFEIIGCSRIFAEDKTENHEELQVRF